MHSDTEGFQHVRHTESKERRCMQFIQCALAQYAAMRKIEVRVYGHAAVESRHAGRHESVRKVRHYLPRSYNWPSVNLTD